MIKYYLDYRLYLIPSENEGFLKNRKFKPKCIF